MGGIIVLLVVIVLVLWILASCIRIVPQAYAVVLERLGAYKATWGTGIHFKVPFIERVARKVNLKEQVVEEQEDKRKYELQALQAQINPHFLYNTLDSIIWMAETQDSNIVAMTEALAKLFRISLNNSFEKRDGTCQKLSDHSKYALCGQVHI